MPKPRTMVLPLYITRRPTNKGMELAESGIHLIDSAKEINHWQTVFQGPQAQWQWSTILKLISEGKYSECFEGIIYPSDWPFQKGAFEKGMKFILCGYDLKR
jgi:hypothetical protein